MGRSRPSPPAAVPTSRCRSHNYGWRRGLALLVSLGVHAAVALVLLQNRAPPLLPVAERIEVVVTGPAPSAAEPLGDAAVPSDISAHNRAKQASTKRSRGAVPAASQLGRSEPNPPAAQAESPADSVAAEPGEANRLSTLLPAHPDLSAVGHLGETAVQRRDLLAPPSNGLPLAAPRELPKVLRGGGGVTADVAEDGALRFHDAKNLSYDARAWSGRFDLTDAVMRKGGQDPYAAVKRKLADETREQRICMARQAQQKRQSEALLGLSARVKQIAGRVDLSPLERRQLVFEIWDECLEAADSSSLDYGAMARAIILAAIREAFPAGSELAYQPAELVALNRRRSSHEKFAPYEAGTVKRWGTGGTTGSTSSP